jgi:16S rRNA (cytidine1402-2'-O)-methyltransferase
MATLYLVATPIGNLEDITLRALRVLGEVSLVAAEDTRVTGRLLAHHAIATQMISFHEFSDQKRIAALVERMGSEDVALVSDAGTPGLSDPGYRLVQAAIQAGIRIIPVPGPSAAVAALVSSGLPTDSFLFLGFLPRQQKARRAALASVAQLPYTLVLYEAPHRLSSLLADTRDILGDRWLCVARELTKLYEETWRGPTSEAILHFQPDQVRGEITVVIEGAKAGESRWTEDEVRSELRELLAAGATSKTAAAELAGLSGWRKREIYSLALQQRQGEDKTTDP